MTPPRKRPPGTMRLDMATRIYRELTSGPKPMDAAFAMKVAALVAPAVQEIADEEHQRGWEEAAQAGIGHRPGKGGGK